jgi:hypothetical protein
MTKLSSSDLKDQVEAAGIKYLPAASVFYTRFLYKVELSPKYSGRGVGGVSGKRGCMIDVANPKKARAELTAFNARMELTISNVEYRQEIRDFVATLPAVEYKTRMGGNNHLFYFRDPALVMLLINRYNTVINSVTGPLNTAHETTMSVHHTLPREKLYYNKFRYSIEFERSEKFIAGNALTLYETLQGMAPGTWRANHLESMLHSYATYQQIMARGAGRKMFMAQPWTITTVIVYLEDPQDYVYLKLMTGEWIKSSHELVLFSELT